MGTSKTERPYVVVKRPWEYLRLIAWALQEEMKQVTEQHPLRNLVNFDIGPYDRFVAEAFKRECLDVLRDPATKRVVGAVAYQIVPVWWAERGTLALAEMFVIALNNSKGFGRIAAQRLEEVATEKGCSFIISGNALATVIPGLDKQVENLYMKKSGYQMKYGQFIKVL